MAGEGTSKKQKDVCYEESECVDREKKEEADDCGLSLEKLKLEEAVPTPRKKLLVISLGGLLCHRVCIKSKADMASIPRSRRRDASYGSYLVFKRPYCEEFMEFCLEKFDVGIWSSAREWYLNSALSCVMGKNARKLLFAWDQEECTDSGFTTLENKKKPIYLKELKKIWEKVYSNLPCSNGELSASNTLLIDNEPYKALLNPPHTAIFPTAYKVNHVNDTGLGPDGELRKYLDGLASAEDVLTYVEKHPFGQPAITPTHKDWSFYSNIIRELRDE